MRLIFLHLIVVLLFFPETGAAFSKCGFIKKKGLGYKDPSIRADGVIIPKGLVLPLLEEDGKRYYSLSFRGEIYSIKKEKVRPVSAKYCVQDFKCLRLTKKARVYRLPNRRAPVIRTHDSGDELNWTGQRTIRSRKTKRRRTWHQVISEGEYGWTLDRGGAISAGSCVKDADRKALFLEADYNFVTSVSADHYSYLLTTIPNRSSVTCLQNPIVSSIDPGQGHRAGVNGLYQMTSWLAVRAGAHFETLTYTVNTLNNPHPDPGNTSCELIDVNIASLSGSSFTIEESNIVLPVGLIYPLRLARNHHIFIGANFNSVLNLEKEQNFQFLTGQTLSKQTSNIQTIGLDSFRTFMDLELKYVYNFPFEKNDTWGISVSVRRQENSTSFGLGILL